jgi:hypothetical protein
MATKEDGIIACPPLNEFTERVLRAWPQWALADFLALSAKGNERMSAVVPINLEIADL